MSGKHRTTAPDIGVALPIVPMLDLSFQLLFFFIITFNPGKPEREFESSMSASGQAKAKDQESVDLSKPSDTEIEVPTDFVVVVRSYDDSFNVAIRTSDKADDIGTARGLTNLTPDKRKAEIDALLVKLKESLEKRKADKDKERAEKKEESSKSDAIKIEANAKTKHQILISVMDACIQSGHARISFAPPPDLNQ